VVLVVDVIEVVDVVEVFLVLVAGQDAIPVGHLDRSVADHADGVVVAEVFDALESLVRLPALGASDGLTHGCAWLLAKVRKARPTGRRRQAGFLSRRGRRAK